MIRFTVPAEPHSKQRARVTKNGTYTPKPTRDAEASVRAAFMAQHMVAGWRPETSRAFSLRVVSYRYERRPRDADNLAKTIMDALNGVVWGDDSQVENLIQTTIWVDDRAEAKTVVEITPLDSIARPPRLRREPSPAPSRALH